MRCAELGPHRASLRPPPLPQQLPGHPSTGHERGQQRQRSLCASPGRFQELSSPSPPFTVRECSQRRQRSLSASPRHLQKVLCRTPPTPMRSMVQDRSQRGQHSFQELPCSTPPAPFPVRKKRFTTTEATEVHQSPCALFAPDTSGPKFVKGESARTAVNSQPELSPLLLKAVCRKLQAAYLPLWPLQRQRLAVLVRDWELVSVYAEKAWQDDNAACVMCASYICQLLRDLAHGTRRMVPVAPGLELPVTVSSLEPGGRAENWPFAFAPFLDKIRSLLADWDEQPERLCPQPKLQELYLMVASGIDDVLFWNLGDVQRFGCLFCQVSGLPAPKCPASVWYQLFRDCDGGARTSLCLETAAKFARHLLERILSFFGSSLEVEAVVGIPRVTAYKIPPQVDYAFDTSTACPSLLASSRSEITSPASAREHVAPIQESGSEYSPSESTLSPREHVAPNHGRGSESAQSDRTIVKQNLDSGCQAISEVTSKRFMPLAALPLEDSLSFFPADLAECPGNLQAPASSVFRCDQNPGEISRNSSARATSKGVEIAHEEILLPARSCMWPKSLEQSPSAREPCTTASESSFSASRTHEATCTTEDESHSGQDGICMCKRPIIGNTNEFTNSKFSSQFQSDVAKFFVNGEDHQAETEPGSEMQHLEITSHDAEAVKPHEGAEAEHCSTSTAKMMQQEGRQGSIGEAVTLAAALAEVLAAIPHLETSASTEDATLQQVRAVAAQVKVCHDNISAIAPAVAAQVKSCNEKISSMCLQSDCRMSTNCSQLDDACQHTRSTPSDADPEQAARQHFVNAVMKSREAREPAPQAGMHPAQWFSMCTPSDSDLGTTMSRSSRGRSMDIHNIPW
mmetsp:Transcript_160124/g.292367  ORF Transcript_160124/g.292367 Transcript_160124/m.292367 type:complete len:857 (-) Transcript_160124:104-2674(-)